MTRRLLRITLIGLVALVALAALLPTISAAIGLKISVNQGSKQEASGTDSPVRGACRGSGVTILIDYGIDSGRPEDVTCVPNSLGQTAQPTSWDLFRLSKIKVEGTQQYPTGFVCRINGYPSPAEQDCQSTPTRKQGSWVYYNMAPGGKAAWRFSMQGAASRHPECGSVEGWVFSSASKPLNQPRLTPTPFVCSK